MFSWHKLFLPVYDIEFLRLENLPSGYTFLSWAQTMGENIRVARGAN